MNDVLTPPGFEPGGIARSLAAGPAERPMRRPDSRLGFRLLVSMLLAGCTPVPVEPPVAEDARTIAAVFETSQPYALRTVDSLRLGAFFAKRPGYRADSASVLQFYRRRAMQFAWIVRDSLSVSAGAFVALAGVAQTGDSAVAPGPSLRQLYEEGYAVGSRVPPCDSCAVDLELRLTSEFFRLAERQYGGKLSRPLRDLDWFIPRGKKDLARLLDSLAVGKMDLSAYEPIHPQYQLLKAHIRDNRALADAPWPLLALPVGLRKLEVGDTAPVVGAIRHRLHLLGDLQADGDRPVYDSTMVRSVERFQERHGLEPDGIIGPKVMGALNVPLAQRLRTMLINMERLRWVPEVQPPDLLLVNIPEFRLHVYEQGREVMTMGVVVGAAVSRTVIFADTVSQIVFSPTWTIPASITRDEIQPKMRSDPDYLRNHDMEVIGGSPEHPVLRQNPGAGNAMGRVKFLFPNSYAIYMHDTPSQGAFSLEQRAFSHGCIRLSRPRELAEYLLRDEPAWTPDRIGEAMFRERETTVRLKQGRPVRIVYFTAWVDGEGRLNFRDDVYGHDERLARELFIEE